MPTSHAILSPSGSARWMVCTPSARSESQVPEKDTIFTREGTIAHAMAEALLLGALRAQKDLREYDDEKRLEWPEQVEHLNEMGGDALTRCFNRCEGEGLDPQEMLRIVSEHYCRPVWEDYLDALYRDPEAVLLVEVPLKLSEYIPEGFGTSDAVIIYGRTLSVYDLKYGKGVPVSAVGNTQMRCYALGSLLGPGELYDITEVNMVIIQPRLQRWSTDSITSEALLDWAENDLKPAAVAAYQGLGEFVPGEHCRFCKVAPRCKALALKASTVKVDRTHDLMTNEEMADALRQASTVKAWIANLEAYALEQALAGTPVPGFKVVEGRSLRQIPDQKAAIGALAKAGLSEDSYLRPRELKTISDLEKLLTKKGFNAILGEYVVKPQGKPTLVEDTDPRPAMSSAKDDFSEYTK